VLSVTLCVLRNVNIWLIKFKKADNIINLHIVKNTKDARTGRSARYLVTLMGRACCKWPCIATHGSCIVGDALAWSCTGYAWLVIAMHGHAWVVHG